MWLNCRLWLNGRRRAGSSAAARGCNGEEEGNRGTPDEAGRGLDRNPTRTFVGGGGGNGLELLSDGRGQFRLHRRLILLGAGGYGGKIS